MKDNSQSEIRTTKVKKNIVYMFLIRGCGIAVSFLYVPLLLHALDKVEYGIWLTLTSIVAWISMFDIGLGNGLRNKLSAALATDNKILGQQLVSTAYVSIFILALFLISLFAIVFPWISWTDVLNAPESMSAIINPLVFVVVVAFCSQFALSLVTSVLFALQLPAFSSLVMMLGQLLSLIAVWTEYKIFGISSLFVLGATVSAIPVLVMLGVSFYIFGLKFPELRPKLKLFHKEHVRSIFSLGIQFFILQIITIVLFQANNLIITHVTGPTEVVVYNVSYKLMHIPVLVFTIIVTPMWSAATDAYTRGDFDWLKVMNRKLLKIVGLITVGALLVLVLSKWIFSIWLGKGELDVSYITSGLLLTQAIFFILYNLHGYMLNGMGKLRLQMIITAALAIAYIPMAIMFGRVWGLNGILIVFAFNSVVNAVWSSIQFNKVVNQKAIGIWNK